MLPSAWRSGVSSFCIRPESGPPNLQPRSNDPMSKALSTVHGRAMQALFGAAAVLMLASCATKNAGLPPTSTANAAAIVTESDETNARKRAKLRVELAVGYFQQGQTTVALDEIKQALAADPTFSDAYNLRGLIYMRLD